MSQISQETIQKAQAAGLSIDWIEKLLEAALKHGPAAIALLKRLLEFFNPQPVFAGHDGDESKQLACKALCDALQAACSCACLHEEICCKG